MIAYEAWVRLRALMHHAPAQHVVAAIEAMDQPQRPATHTGYDTNACPAMFGTNQCHGPKGHRGPWHTSHDGTTPVLWSDEKGKAA